jgi:hypothetical protein
MSEINEAQARKVLETVDAGLVQGMGIAEPGKMCVEAAVCYAFGMEHGDNPTCVGYAVRAFKIRLNDSCWSSDKARTQGMRKLAIAQLGSDTIDQRAFADLVVVATCNRILPFVLRAAASKAEEPHKAVLLAAIPACEAATDRKSAKSAAKVAKNAAAAAAAAYAADAAYADAAYAAAAGAAYAADAADAARDEVLNLAAEIGLDALKKLNSPGCTYLFLTEMT